jgi:hypothetical protein
MMQRKILNFFLILTSLFGYLEWGRGQHTFLFQAESDILYKLFTDPMSVAHPFIVLPIVGQIMLCVTLFQKTPNKTLTYLSIGGLGILLIFIFLIGLISLNFSIAISAIPFLIFAVMTIQRFKQS